MKVFCGTDIIEIDRIKKAINNSKEKFIDKVFTKTEIDYCNSKKNQKYQHYAARFAAKEAVFKAISQKLDNKFQIDWKDIEIKNNEQGKPYVNVNTNKLNLNFNNEAIDISISHCKEYATAMAIIVE